MLENTLHLIQYIYIYIYINLRESFHSTHNQPYHIICQIQCFCDNDRRFGGRGGFGGVGRGSEGSGRFGARHRGSEGFARGLRLEIYVHKSSPKVHEKFTMVNFQKTHKYNVFCTLKAHRPESSPKVHQRFSKMSRVLEAQNLRQGLAWGKIARAPQNLSLGWPKTLLGLPARSSQLEVPSFSSQLEVQRPQITFSSILVLARASAGPKTFRSKPVVVI
jgi:hypothetical protein